MDPLDRLAAGRREFGEYGGVNASVEISTTFTVLNAGTLPAIFAGEVGPDKGGCYVYGRAFNPTVRHLGRHLAALEATEAAYPCGSGMAAISTSLLSLCKSGDHIVASNTVYGGTHALLKTFLPEKCSIDVSFVDITDLSQVAAAMTPRTKVLYTEVLSNPTLCVADLRQLAALAHRQGQCCQLVVDNTFSPCMVTPALLGADVVIHSLTKFVSGASDIIAGVICGRDSFINGLMDFHTGPGMLLGPTMDPRVASELALRMPHLALRVQEHSRRAAAYAARLEALGAAVTYPGLASHPQHRLLASMLNPAYGFGGLLGLDFESKSKAEMFMERLQNRHGFGFMAVSLGYFDTLMSCSAVSTSSELSDGDKAASGIRDGYVRMSVGITGTLEERLRQLEETYRFVTQLGPEAQAAPYRAVKVKRHPDGRAEPLYSWPSTGSFDNIPGTQQAAAAPGSSEQDDEEFRDDSTSLPHAVSQSAGSGTAAAAAGVTVGAAAMAVVAAAAGMAAPAGAVDAFSGGAFNALAALRERVAPPQASAFDGSPGPGGSPIEPVPTLPQASSFLYGALQQPAGGAYGDAGRGAGRDGTDRPCKIRRLGSNEEVHYCRMY